MSEKIEIIIVDDHLSYREGLESVLKPKNIFVIGHANNGFDLLHLLNERNLKPDVVLLDLQMEEMDGAETLRRIKEKYQDLKVIILTSFSDGWIQNDLKQKGASAFINKASGSNVIADTIKQTHYLKGYTNIPKKVKSLFTEKEIKIIPLLLEGKTSKQIADTLNIAEKTVEQYRNRLYDKTGSKNGTQFGVYCSDAGLSFLD